MLLAALVTLSCAFALCACIGDRHTHTYTEKVVAPTCTEAGYTEHTCECGESYKDSEKPAVHDTVYHEAKAATCTERGWEAYETCSRCDYTTYKEIAAGHDIVKYEAKAATCTEVGWEEYETCSRCDYTTYKEIAALGHNYSEIECIVCHTKAPTVGLEYTLSEDGTYYIVTGIGTATEKDIVIADIYNDLPVTSIGWRAFEGCSSLTSITIPDRESISYLHPTNSY